jgi:type I restriction enzyme M protein
MLDTDTKRRIDTARDILVGKLPDPKSQVEQITIALIYKFMNDMDAESEELGGLRSFFAGDFAGYGWAKLMRSGLSGHETLNLYAEAIARMPENPGIPALFRNIFKNAYLPYRDPETLRMFLKVIDEFSYDHSERLGDAFEYLLSVLGSQGDAGQFRTPRHIIDFMVKIVDPKKDEKILDPACGTAGFLISSYKHILASNKDEKGNSSLTPDEKGSLAQNLTGYDISPDMVRLSLVNLYLHGFVDPHIHEYDTLTSLERWNEYADVILANPPFMSPKGGIRPHNRFSVPSKRSEVLFVDYMAEHLSSKGRAAIIVPEGIIFQSQGAYVRLRKMLVDDFLVAVVSLPAGVFQPYSGVKTSILILDKELAKHSSTIGFFKVENDGFGLGAQRKLIIKNDLPRASDEIAEYLRRLRSGESVDTCQLTLGLIATKEKVAANSDYNLSGERYRENVAGAYNFPLMCIGEISEVNPSKREALALAPDTVVSFVPMSDLGEHRIAFSPKEKRCIGELGTSYTYFADNDVLLAKVTPCFENGKAGVAKGLNNGIGFGSSEFYVLRPCDRILSEYLYFCVMHSIFREQATAQMTGTGGLQRIPKGFIERFKIPVPPLEVQKEIVEEIEGYQKVIDGAWAVIKNYRPNISIDQNWPFEKLGNLCLIRTGKKDVNSGNHDGIYPFFTCAREHTFSDTWSFDCEAILISGNGDVGSVQYY